MILNFDKLIFDLKTKTYELKGLEAHDKLNVPGRPHYSSEDIKNFNPKKASVIILLFPKNNEILFPLILRNTYEGIHSAQIGLPGGKIEKNESKKQAAIRETFEEIGVLEEKINIICKLSNLYIPVSNFLVHPFLAYIDFEPIFNIDSSEVSQLYLINLNDLIESKISFEFLKEINYKIPVFKIINPPIWGATAMILQEFKEVLNQVI